MEITDSLVETLVNEACTARTHAHAPYSGFAVGAALADEHGDVYVGCNVENASYGATICAERGAVVAAIAQAGRPSFSALAVVTNDDPPAVPCALCLQVLSEFCSPEFPIMLATIDGTVHRTLKLRELLPIPFTSFRSS